MSQLEERQAGRILSYSKEGQHFVSTQAFNRWDEVHPHYGGGQSTLFCLLFLMLSLPKKHHPRNTQNNI